jgi:single-strand DNA-binding protein
MNVCTFVGNLTADPDAPRAVGEGQVVRFRIAVSERFGKGKEVTTFLDAEAWDGLAGVVGSYCRKGTKVAVSGSLRMDEWADKNNPDQKRVKYFVRVREFSLLTPKGEGEAAPAKGKVPAGDDGQIPF